MTFFNFTFLTFTLTSNIRNQIIVNSLRIYVEILCFERGQIFPLLLERSFEQNYTHLFTPTGEHLNWINRLLHHCLFSMMRDARNKVNYLLKFWVLCSNLKYNKYTCSKL